MLLNQIKNINRSSTKSRRNIQTKMGDDDDCFKVALASRHSGYPKTKMGGPDRPVSNDQFSLATLNELAVKASKDILLF